MAAIVGHALRCGIGSTTNLFIAQPGLPASPESVDEAKLGVLLGSLASALLGYIVLRSAAAKPT